nr:hypothetical protein [Tanacetum cinerariifolium]
MLHVLRVEMVIISPWMLSKNWLVYKQTAFGKDMSNPFMADSLPKIVWFLTHHITCMKSWLVQKQTALGQTATGKESSNPFMAGVNTPRSDEDRLKLMELMVFLLQRNVCMEIGINAALLSKLLLSGKYAAEGFEQIIDFLSGSYINHALTMNPHVYISCIKQFWNTAVVKQSGDVTRLQALVDKRRIMITEEVVHEILQLNDAEGQRFNFSNYIFESLLRNVDSSSKFYMYPRFVQLIIQTNIADLSKHTTRYISPALTQKVFANMRRVGKGFSGVKTPLFESMLVVRDVAEEAEVQVLAQGDDVQEHVVKEDEGIELVADQEKDAEVEGRHAYKEAEIYNIDLDHSSKVLSMQEDDTEVQEAIKIVTTAKLMTEVVTAAATQVVATSTPIPAAKPKKLNIAAAPAVSTRRRKRVVIKDPEEELLSDTLAESPKVKDKGKGIFIEAPKPMKKKDQIELDAEYARKLQEEINKEHEETYKNINWNVALDHVQSKEPQYIKRYHGMKKKPQTKSEACKNMIFYLKNPEGYKMDFFKGKKYDEILPIFQAKFDANMRRQLREGKLSEEAQEAETLKKRLEIVQDEDDDAFVEATPLAQKVLVVDYQIVVIENKPRYPLSIFTLEQLVNVARLQVEEESEMSLELLRRKGVVIRDPEEELLSNTLAESPKVKEKGKGIFIEAPNPIKKKDQIELDAEYARKLQEEINKEHEETYKNLNWNVALDYVQSKEPHINETPAQKASKRRKLSKEAQEAETLKKRLEIVQDEDDDVFVEATSLAQKVPVVDYQIVVIENKPREDLETLWRIVRDRFSTSKPINFLDEYLLLTLKTMFEEPDGQDAIWRNQKSVNVERRYPLSRFTLEQLVNVARLQVEEESEMSLELLRVKDTLSKGPPQVVSEPENGATLPKTQVVDGVITMMPITTAEKKAQRRLEVKARRTLMMSIPPNEYQLKFNSIKQLLEAVEKRFGRNVAAKKTQRSLLKQQYENITASNLEMLD